jgi:hypothetical protein
MCSLLLHLTSSLSSFHCVSIYQSQSIYYNAFDSSVQMTVFAKDARKSIVLYSNGTFMLFSASSSAMAPGIGIMVMLPALPTSALASAVLITTNTATDPFYGASASPASFAFQNSTWLWICDDGGASTKGVWLFFYNAAVALFQPSSATSRVWSSSTCSDMVLQMESPTAALYWVGGTTAGNGIYRMPVNAGAFVVTLIASAAGNSSYRGISQTPRLLTQTPTPSQTITNTATPSSSPSQTQTISQGLLAPSSYSGTLGLPASPCCYNTLNMYKFGEPACFRDNIAGVEVSCTSLRVLL